MQIPHHKQVIVMTDLVAAKSGDQQIRAIADRISHRARSHRDE
jgi:uncharacterized protein (DUF305 family)